MIDKSIFNINYANKKILLRIDISCPIYDNKIIDEYRLHLNLPFIQLLLENGCSLIILSNNNDNSLELVSKKLQELLPQYPVNFINENSTEVVSEKCVNLNNEILVLENVEFNKDDLVIKEGVVKF
jgi:3-phosphoglycerate kinase